MNTTPSTCPICHSSFCCCLEHLFPDQPEFHNRYKQAQAEPLHGAYQPGQAEPQVKLGPETANGPGLSQESCSWPHGGLLPKGVGASRTPVSDTSPLPQAEYEEAYSLALALAKGVAPGRTPQEGQTKRASLLEAFANILIGFWVSVLANMLVLPHFKNPGVFREAFLIGLIFTVISFVRSYLLRRLFNLFHLQGRKSLRSPWKP